MFVNNNKCKCNKYGSLQQLVEFANIDADNTHSQFVLKQILINLNLYNKIWLIKKNSNWAFLL